MQIFPKALPVVCADSILNYSSKSYFICWRLLHCSCQSSKELILLLQVVHWGKCWKFYHAMYTFLDFSTLLPIKTFSLSLGLSVGKFFACYSCYKPSNQAGNPRLDSLLMFLYILVFNHYYTSTIAWMSHLLPLGPVIPCILYVQPQF